MRNPNLDQLIAAATALRPMLPELVFVGGCVTGLLLTDEAAGEPRTTIDVDVIAEITSYAQYETFSERLRGFGFHEDATEGAPLCRWVQDRLILDVMPLDADILGFSNRWYPAAMKAAMTTTLRKDLDIRIVTAPYFAATKLEAFNGRGGGDFLASHDLEDLVSIVDGRQELNFEIQTEEPALRHFVSHGIAKLLDEPRFTDALPGFLRPDAASQSRIVIVLRRLEALASL